MSKNLSLEKTASSYDPDIVCSDNLRQNVWNKGKKSS